MAKKKVTEEMLREAGLETPVEFLLRVMHDKDKSLAIRMEAAKNASPYIHRKMPLEIETSNELKLIGPFVPSLHQLAEQYPEEIGEDFQITDNSEEVQEGIFIEVNPENIVDDFDDI